MSTPLIRILATALFGLPMIAVAEPIDVTYDIGYYRTDGFSASWVHEATGCYNGDGLYMCGGSLLDVSGSISGSLEDGILTVTGGSLTIGSDATGYMTYDVQSGTLGGDFNWVLDIDHFGLFTFENLSPTGDNKPNSFNGDTFVLWGQNQAAYDVTCSPSYTNEYCDSYTSYGIDLYGVRRVPEPATLALFGLGLMGMGWARWRNIRIGQIRLSRIS